MKLIGKMKDIKEIDKSCKPKKGKMEIQKIIDEETFYKVQKKLEERKEQNLTL